VQPIPSHYAKYAILAHFKGSFLVKKKTLSLSADIESCYKFPQTLQKIWLWIPKDRDISEASTELHWMIKGCYKYDK
jgi:hypothetical protein